jgi:hypothetical protein
MFSGTLRAQKVVQPGDSLYWLKAMDDTHANYYDALESFEKFWSDKARPSEEFEEELNELRDGHHTTTEDGHDQNGPARKYAFEYKRFREWCVTIGVFHHEDGTVLTAEEKIDLWKKYKR